MTAEEMLWEYGGDILRSPTMAKERTIPQHGSTTCFDHSVAVTLCSIRLAEKWGWDVDWRSLVRGALLHDYFLYDWHDPSRKREGLHGFVHPKTALKNAREDFELSPVEENIIVRHMFPLTPHPPACREAWLVCAADKYCALQETVHPFFSRLRRRSSGAKRRP